jgi:hypothetical protein
MTPVVAVAGLELAGRPPRSCAHRALDGHSVQREPPGLGAGLRSGRVELEPEQLQGPIAVIHQSVERGELDRRFTSATFVLQQPG